MDAIIPYILSALTIIVMILAGRKDARAWLLGIANQGLWLIFIIRTESWGLLLLLVALLVVYSRNYLKLRNGQ